MCMVEAKQEISVNSRGIQDKTKKYIYKSELDNATRDQ